MNWNYSNMFMNMCGCNGWGGNYTYGSSIAQLFSDVSGISCLFNYGDYGYYGSDCGCSSSSSSSVNWGHILGYAAAFVSPFIVGGVVSGVQRNKAAQASNEQGFKNALKTLGFPESTSPENISVDKINSATTLSAEADKKLRSNLTELENAHAKAKETYEGAALNALKPDDCNATDLEGILDAWVGIATANATAPENETPEQATARGELKSKAERMQKTIAELIKVRDSWEKTDGANAKKLKAAEEKYNKDKEVAEQKLKDAAETAKNYLQEWQKKALDDADGTRASRSRAKQVKFDTGENKNENDYGDIKQYDKYDWQKLLYAYRTGNSNVQNEIKKLLQDNLDAIKKTHTYTQDQGMLLENVLGISLS